MTFAIVGGLVGAGAGAAGLGGLTALTGGLLGAAVGSSVGGARAADRAADVQAQAAQQAGDIQQQQFERQVQLQEPWRQSGIAAQNRLLTLLGLNPNQPGQVPGYMAGGVFMPLPGGATDTGLSVDTSAPDFGSLAKPFGMSQFQADPGYAFRLGEGLKALERSAAARGGLMSGATGKALQRYGQDLGSQEYMNAFNRYQTERSNLLNPLQSLAGVGQTSTNALGNAGQTMASNVGNAMMSAGAARASGYVGGANALTGGLGQYLNYRQGQDLLSTLRGNSTYGGGYTAMPTYSPNYLEGQYNPVG